MGSCFEVGTLVSYFMGVRLAVVQACTAWALQLSQHVARVSVISDHN